MPLTSLGNFRTQRELTIHRIALLTLVATSPDATLEATLDALEHGDRVDRDVARLIREIDRQLAVETGDASRDGAGSDMSKEWREIAEWDWVELGSGERLHAVATVTNDPGNGWYADGTTACGREGRMFIPGLLSRMGAQRCLRCCIQTGMPEGKQSPKNVEALRPIVKARLAAILCPECSDTGYVEEGCCCYQCEYDDSAHRRLVPCLECPKGQDLAEKAERQTYLREMERR